MLYKDGSCGKGKTPKIYNTPKMNRERQVKIYIKSLI